MLEGNTEAEERFRREGKVILKEPPKPKLVEEPKTPLKAKLVVDSAEISSEQPISVDVPKRVHQKNKSHYTGQPHEKPANDARKEEDRITTEVEIVGLDTPSVPVPVSEPLFAERVAEPVIVEGIDVAQLRVAYFTMEVGLSGDFPFYSGGLGILAGDALKSFADLNLPVVGVSLLYRKGYFRQRFDERGWQFEEPEAFSPEGRLVLLPQKVRVLIEGRPVVVRAWLHRLEGVSGRVNPVLFLDTDTDENTPEDRGITHTLYAGDHRYRLKQEAILGIGGVRMLELLGATRIEKYHMNEGHAALLALELYRRHMLLEDPVAVLHRLLVFTTHTPIAAGHDRFDLSLVHEVLGRDIVPAPLLHAVTENGKLNMTRLGFELSGHINGVAKKHGDVTREMFPGYKIDAITNGVHARTWVAPPIARVFGTYLRGWESDPSSLRYALSLPSDEVWNAHQEAKRHMLDAIAARTGIRLDENVFTIGFARRATAYKRAELLFFDVERLSRIAQKSGKGVQVVLAGKAHPHDHEGKLGIQRVIAKIKALGPRVRAVYLENYDIDLAKLLVSGTDLWLNTPIRPQEASGTSGMKAALNGVPQLSVLDGWWLEGHIEGVTGWSIGPHPEHTTSVSDREDAESLYTKLEYLILPRYYDERDAWIRMMRHTIAINGSFFNTHRMVEQYVLTTYFL